jgi:hypothetical protein
MNISADVPRRRGLKVSGLNWWPATTSSWIAVAFVVAFILAATVLVIFGVGDRGTTIALRLTARWSFLLFWSAYTGGAMSKLFGPRFVGLARRGRDFGLAFASSQLVHVGLVLWFFYLAPGTNGGMLFFWIGVACTYLLALFSLPRLRDALGPRLWRLCCEIALNYIMLVFAVDFIRIPLQEDGLDRYPLTYAPFAIMLVVGVGLRFAAFARHKSDQARSIRDY